MKEWIAERLILLAIWLDVETVIYTSFDVVGGIKEAIKEAEAAAKPKGNAGRPLGSKDKKPRKRPVRKEQEA
jgi:hypothetical protein